MNAPSQPSPSPLSLDLRYQVAPSDREVVAEIVESTGFFNPAEVAVAVELVDERLAKGVASGYHFVFARSGDRTCAYSCYGPIAGTLHSFDLYWIAVHQAFQNRGLGGVLLAHTEQRILHEGGHRIYVETSSRPQYQPTRNFYERHGYRLEADVKDFYAPGDGKLIYVKTV